MRSRQGYEFRIATGEEEFAEIHRLNYLTFVEEIPQHAPNAGRRLVDRFHGENTYVIALHRGRLVGMIALRVTRPFSLDGKLPDLDAHLPPGRSPCEVRLLAVDPDYRHGRVFWGLVERLVEHGRRGGFDLALISGTLRQVRLYRNLGFVPFGPVVGTAEAPFQPMYLTLEGLVERAGHLLGAAPEVPPAAPWSFLPGPVALRPEVAAALARPAVSHRSAAFLEQVASIEQRLRTLTGARRVEILLGSGTLGNDAVAAQLGLAPERGLVLVNGEFGERLVDHARRAGLAIEVLAIEWGEAFEREAVARALDGARARWLWAVHCETSTGVLNDLGALQEVAAGRGARLVLDCTSSLGTVPVDLSGVAFATSVSGKGLGAFPGLALVFHRDVVAPRPDRLPRYLDLGLYAAAQGVPFTQSSNLVAALAAALELPFDARRFAALARLAAWLRARLRELGFRLVAPESCAAPGIVTLALPPEVCAAELGERLEREGYLLSHRSGYLCRRNWIQISLLGDVSRQRLAAVLGALERPWARGPEEAPAPPAARRDGGDRRPHRRESCKRQRVTDLQKESGGCDE